MDSLLFINQHLEWLNWIWRIYPLFKHSSVSLEMTGLANQPSCNISIRHWGNKDLIFIALRGLTKTVPTSSDQSLHNWKEWTKSLSTMLLKVREELLKGQAIWRSTLRDKTVHKLQKQSRYVGSCWTWNLRKSESVYIREK